MANREGTTLASSSSTRMGEGRACACASVRIGLAAAVFGIPQNLNLWVVVIAKMHGCRMLSLHCCYNNRSGDFVRRISLLVRGIFSPPLSLL
jgi:hypothetical protein